MQNVVASSEYMNFKCKNNTVFKQKNLHIFSIVSGFCRAAIISLASDFNNGAMQCDCGDEGSLDQNCDKIGGQCNCKENIMALLKFINSEKAKKSSLLTVCTVVKSYVKISQNFVAFPEYMNFKD